MRRLTWLPRCCGARCTALRCSRRLCGSSRCDPHRAIRCERLLWGQHCSTRGSWGLARLPMLSLPASTMPPSCLRSFSRPAPGPGCRLRLDLGLTLDPHPISRFPCLPALRPTPVHDCFAAGRWPRTDGRSIRGVSSMGFLYTPIYHPPLAFLWRRVPPNRRHFR